MEQMNEEVQILALEKVLEEMKNAEKYLMKWNAYWWESYNEFPYDDICTINWLGIQTNNSIRRIVFNKKGEISLEKGSKKRQTTKHSKKVEYTALYNVLSNNFNINVMVDELTKDYRKTHKLEHFTFSLDENILTEKINDVEMVLDLNTGIRLVRIIKGYDKRDRNNNASVVFECVLNSFDSLEMCAAVINTHKGNGKINGTYRIIASREKGISANFYSRKGVKIDLTKNPMLLESANNLLLESTNKNSSSETVISSFANSTQSAVNKNFSEKVINFDNSQFNIEFVREEEIRIINIIKSIKGEIPLTGLVERIDNCMNLINSIKMEKLEEKAKVLRLSNSRNNTYE